MKRLYAIRGATTVELNTPADIDARTTELTRELIAANAIAADEAVKLVISVTKDITKRNPATAVRESKLLNVPLFCVQEADMEGALPLTIRFMLDVYKEEGFRVTHCYLHKAQTLLPNRLKTI